MTVVVDASVVVPALVDEGDLGHWARSLLSDAVSTHLMPVEVMHTMRRLARVVDLGDGWVADLFGLGLDLVDFESLAPRAWLLRDTVTAYDAWYVALAEALEAPLATLDARLAAAPGPRCEFVLPGAAT